MHTQKFVLLFFTLLFLSAISQPNLRAQQVEKPTDKTSILSLAATHLNDDWKSTNYRPGKANPIYQNAYHGPVKRVSSLLYHEKGAETPLETRIVEFRKDGQIDHIEMQYETDTVQILHTFDDLGRIIEEQIKSSQRDKITRWTYDQAGNRDTRSLFRRSEPVGCYRYILQDNRERIEMCEDPLDYNTEVLEYNDAGLLVSQHPLTEKEGTVNTYLYDAKNRLKRVESQVYGEEPSLSITKMAYNKYGFKSSDSQTIEEFDHQKVATYSYTYREENDNYVISQIEPVQVKRELIEVLTVLEVDGWGNPVKKLITTNAQFEKQMYKLTTYSIEYWD